MSQRIGAKRRPMINSANSRRVRGYSLSIERNPSSGTDCVRATFSTRGEGKKNHPDRASAPSIMVTALARPYTATNEPKRGPFSWPSST